MLNNTDREHWRRRARTRRSSGAILIVISVVLLIQLVNSAIVLIQLLRAGPGGKAAVEEALRLGWNGVSPAETYSGHIMWVRDVLGGAILNAILLMMVVVGGLIGKQEFRRQERMWEHVNLLEARKAREDEKEHR